jgi:hypothetical protein
MNYPQKKWIKLYISRRSPDTARVIIRGALFTKEVEMGEYHGDEPEIEAEYQARREAYEEEHADDWKYE